MICFLISISGDAKVVVGSADALKCSNDMAAWVHSSYPFHNSCSVCLSACYKFTFSEERVSDFLPLKLMNSYLSISLCFYSVVAKRM